MDNRIKQAQYWARRIGYHSAKRPAERAALQLWEKGYVNLFDFFRRYEHVYRSLPPLSNRPALEDALLLPPQSFGQKCTQCGQRKAKTGHYWHRDKQQRSGWKTICIMCCKQKRLKKSQFLG